MNKRLVLFVVASVLLIAMLIKLGLHQRKPLAALASDAQTNPSAMMESSNMAAYSSQPKKEVVKPSGFPTKAFQPTNSETTNEIFKQLGASLDRAKSEWRTPISFYGKVVDQPRREWSAAAGRLFDRPIITAPWGPSDHASAAADHPGSVAVDAG